jgi:peptide/nickel transport system permease protein
MVPRTRRDQAAGHGGSPYEMIVPTAAEAPRSATMTSRLARHGVLIVSAAALAVIILLSVAAPLVTPHDPTRARLPERFQPPSIERPFGTDHLGRDLFSRVLYGGRVSLVVGAAATLFGLVVGFLLGALAAYIGGSIDNLIMRFVDLVLMFPYLLVAILIVSILGFSLTNVVLAIGLSAFPGYARLARSLVLGLKEQDFVAAAKSLGASHARVIATHIVPNCISTLVVYSSLYFGRAILAEAGLSFIGLGIQPPDTSWGILVADGKRYLRTYPHLAMIPGFAVMVTVLCVNILGDAIRDRLDPRLARQLR